MTLIRKVARPLLGASFIAGGVERLRRPDAATKQLQPALDELASVLPQAEVLASKATLTTQVLGGVQVAAGAALAIGKFPRLAALTLTGVHALSSYAEYRTAPLDDEKDVTAQRTSLLKNVSILGGLGIASVDLAGKPSLSWRAEHLSKQASKKSAQFKDKTLKWADELGDDATSTLKALEKDAKKNFRRAEREAVKVITKGADKVKP